MAKGKKFDYRVVQDNGSWCAEIVRRASARESVVSKRQNGFATEAEAQAWGERELLNFVQHLKNRNQQHATERQERTANE
jgi:hypothetical protein